MNTDRITDYVNENADIKSIKDDCSRIVIYKNNGNMFSDYDEYPFFVEWAKSLAGDGLSVEINPYDGPCDYECYDKNDECLGKDYETRGNSLWGVYCEAPQDVHAAIAQSLLEKTQKDREYYSKKSDIYDESYVEDCDQIITDCKNVIAEYRRDTVAVGDKIIISGKLLWDSLPPLKDSSNPTLKYGKHSVIEHSTEVVDGEEREFFDIFSVPKHNSSCPLMDGETCTVISVNLNEVEIRSDDAESDAHTIFLSKTEFGVCSFDLATDVKKEINQEEQKKEATNLFKSKEKYSIEEDKMGNVTITELDTKHDVYLQGDDAALFLDTIHNITPGFTFSQQEITNHICSDYFVDWEMNHPEEMNKTSEKTTFDTYIDKVKESVSAAKTTDIDVVLKAGKEVLASLSPVAREEVHKEFLAKGLTDEKTLSTFMKKAVSPTREKSVEKKRESERSR